MSISAAQLNGLADGFKRLDNVSVDVWSEFANSFWSASLEIGTVQRTGSPKHDPLTLDLLLAILAPARICASSTFNLI